MRPFILFGAGLLGLCAANRLNRRYAIKERHEVPPGFTREGDAPGNHLVRLQVALKQSKFDELERHLYESTSKIRSMGGFCSHSHL